MGVLALELLEDCPENTEKLQSEPERLSFLLVVGEREMIGSAVDGNMEAICSLVGPF